MKNKFAIKKSQIQGLGAFATQIIKKGELIYKVRGESISIEELKKRYKKGTERSSDPLQIKESRYLDLYKPYVYMNHSCNPNSAIVKLNDLIAIKNIPTGKEITYDYSLTDWSEDKDWPGYADWVMRCKCNSSVCRQKIREFRFLHKHIQKKCIKQDMVPDYIVRKYKKNNVV